MIDLIFSQSFFIRIYYLEPTPTCVPNGQPTDGCMGCLSCDPKPCCSGCCDYDATPVGPVATRIDRWCEACK